MFNECAKKGSFAHTSRGKAAVWAKTALFAQIVLLSACSAPMSHIPQGATAVYDLRTGQELTVRQAAKADGFYGTLREDGQSIAFVRYNPDAFQTTVVTAEKEQADSTGALCLKYDAIAGINGSFFNRDSLQARTFIKDDGFIIGDPSVKPSLRVNGAVVLNPESIRIEACDTAGAYDLDWEVMAAGPLLMEDGQTETYEEDIPGWESFYAKSHPRSLIGRDAAGGVWMVVVDGRFPGEAEGMTIAQLTALSRRFGLVESLNLDGGGSSTLWVLPEGVINHPCDNGRFDHEGQRVVPNIIIVK